MMSSRIRLGGMALAAQLLAAVLALHWLQAFSAGAMEAEETLASSLCLQAPVLLFTWLVLGSLAGAASLLAASALCLLTAASTGLYNYNLIILVFLGAAAAGQLLRGRLLEAIRGRETELEALDEKINDTQAQVAQQTAVGQGLERRTERAQALKEALSSFSQALSLTEIARNVVDKTDEIFGRKASCLFFIVDEAEQELSLLASRAEGAAGHTKSKRGDLLDGWVLKQRKSLLVEDARKDFRFNLNVKELERPFLSVAASPLVAEQKVIGVLRLDSAEAGAFSADDLRLLGILADLAAVSLKNGLLYARIQDLAIRDGLTGLFVHRHFRERLLEELSRCRRAAQPLSLLFFDIDLFKSYNDRFGHSAGDIVLREVAAGLKTLPGVEGLAARVGGEEFAALLPGVSREEAQDIAEAFRRRIEEQVFILRRQASRVTVSIGVAAFPENGQDPEELLRKADECLYRAKQTGRNRVCVASSS